MADTYVPMDPEQAGSILAEGFHTAFRKGIPDTGDAVWQAIDNLPDEEWDTAMDWLMDSLKRMGLTICYKEGK